MNSAKFSIATWLNPEKEPKLCVILIIIVLTQQRQRRHWKICFRSEKVKAIASHLTLHDGGPNHIETIPLLCQTNQWTGFYIIGISVMKGLKMLQQSNI